MTGHGGGGGSRNILAVENTQVIENSTRQKRTILQNRAQLERIWNAGRTGKELESPLRLLSINDRI